MPQQRKIFVRPIGLIRGLACKSRVRPVGVVIADPAGQADPQLRASLERMEIDALLLQ